MKILATILGAALAVCGALNAQSADRMTVKFPAPVMINGATLPAGEATIQIFHNSGTVMLAVRSDSGEHASVLVNRMNINEDEAAPKVIFDHKADGLHLNRILLTNHTALQVLDAD